MVRKLALAVSLALGTLSVPVHALGLGELSSKSTLNQNFRGDIALLSVQPDELDSIRVKLADPDAFERAGVERPFYLSLLKFEPTVNAGGKTVVRVTSEFPIREPFLNFLVEINWPNGRLLREYTVLLDPPVTTMRRSPTVTPAARTAAPVATPAPAAPSRSAAPVKAQSAPVPVAPAVAAAPGQYGPVKANDTAWRIAGRLRPEGVSMEQMMMALLAANPEAFINGNINRLKRGKILRVPALAEIQEITRQQARQAYREQQDQWLARRDAKLQERAARAVSTDVQPSVDEGASDDQLRIATARPDGEGEAGASEDDAVSPTANDLKSRLMVARENAETSRQEAETLRSQVDDLEVRLRDMQKLLSLKDEQLAQLQDRMAADAMVADETPAEPIEATTDEAPVAEESEAADVQLVNQAGTEAPVGDDVDPVEQAMAEAEAATEESTAAESEATEIIVEPASPSGLDPDFLVADIPPQVDPNAIVERTMAVDTDPAGEELVIGDDAVPAEIVIGEDIDGAAASEEPVAELAIEPAPGTAPDPSEPAADPEPQAAVAMNTPTADRASSPLVPTALAGMVEKNIVPIAGGTVLLLGLIGWLVTRGRSKADQDNDLQLAAAGAPAAEMPAADLEVPAVDQPVPNDTLSDLPDSAFLDEFSPSDINALQDETGEVDPVSEADVYIAYGRYQQAEDLLRQAMEREPDRLALKHKLLEVHYATRNAGAFTTLAQAMVDAGQDTVDEEAWVRAQDMGRELVPDHPLFESKDGGDLGAAGMAAAAAVAGAAAADTVDDDTLSLDGLDLSDLSELSDEYEPDKDPVENLDSSSEVSISLDLDDSLENVEPITADASQTQETPESISLDELESLDFELPEAESSKPTTDDSSFDLSSETLDLDTMMAEAEAAVDGADSTTSLESEFSADELQAQLDELSDLSVLDSGLGESQQQTSEPAAALGLDLEDVSEVSDDLNTPLELDTAFETAEPDVQGDEVLDLDLGESNDSAIGEDDVATKLDLARAYVEMGDEEGARSILEEVLAEGNAEQKSDAEKLIADLA